MPNYPLDLPLAPHDLSLEELAYVNDVKNQFVKLLAIGRSADALVVLGRSSKLFERYSYASQGFNGLINIGNKEKAAGPYANIVDNNLQNLRTAIKDMRLYQGPLDEIRRATGARVTMVDTETPGNFIACQGYWYDKTLRYGNVSALRAAIGADQLLLITALGFGANAIAHYARMWKDEGLEVIGTPILISARRKQR